MIHADELDVVVDHVGRLLGRDVVRPDPVHHPFGEGGRNVPAGLGSSNRLFVGDVSVASSGRGIGLVLVEPRRQ